MVSSLIFEHNFHVIRCFVDTRNQMLKKIHHTLLPVVNIVLNFTFPRNNPWYQRMLVKPKHVILCRSTMSIDAE